MAYNNYFLLFLGFTAFLAEMKMLHLLRYSQTISVLGKALSDGAADLMNVGFCMALLLLSFAVFCFLMFGQKIEDYSSISTSASTLAIASIGKFDFSAVYYASGTFGQTVLLVYLISMMIIVVNIFISVICDLLAAVAEQDPPKDHEVITHLMHSIAAIVSGQNNNEKNKTHKGNSRKGKSILLSSSTLLLWFCFRNNTLQYWI